MACLSRAPGFLPPPCPAPTSLKMGWSGVKGGMPGLEALTGPRVRARRGINRRPPFLMFGSNPRRISRHTVERDTPIASPASPMPTNESSESWNIPEPYHFCLIVSIVSNRYLDLPAGISTFPPIGKRRFFQRVHHQLVGAGSTQGGVKLRHDAFDQRPPFFRHSNQGCDCDEGAGNKRLEKSEKFLMHSMPILLRWRHSSREMLGFLCGSTEGR